MARRDPFYKHFIGESAEETAHLSLDAIGALIRFKDKAWNAPSRGVLIFPIDGFARLFRCERADAERLIDELINPIPVLQRADLADGKIQLTYVPFVENAELSNKRATSGRQGGFAKRESADSASPVQNHDEECVAKRKQKGSKSLALALATPGDRESVRGIGDEEAIRPDISDESIPLDNRVRVWLDGMKRFPFIQTSPKHVSDIVFAVRKWGFDFVGECLEIAFDNGARSPVPYALGVAEKKAGRHFAEQPKPIQRAGSGTRKTFKPG